MRIITLIFISLLILLSCQSNFENQIIGKWEKFDYGNDGIVILADEEFKEYLIITKKEKDFKINIEMPNSTSAFLGTIDNIFFDGSELTFRIIQSEFTNQKAYWKLKLDNKNKILNGEIKDCYGKIHKFKCKKVN